MAVTEPTTFSALVAETARRVPERKALAFPDGDLLYGELLARAHERADDLLRLGVGPGDRFGLLAANCPEFVEFLLGAALLGAVTVPINTRFRPRELAHVVADAELTTVVATGGTDPVAPNFAQVLLETIPQLADADDPFELALDGYPRLRSAMALGGGVPAGLADAAALHGRELQRPRPPLGVLPAEAPLLIMYTSGTTAYPKGCVISNGSFAHNALAIAERLEIDDDDRWWDPLPLFHMGGIMLMASVLARGGLFGTMSRFSAPEAFELIDRIEPTVLYPLFPTITLDLMHDQSFPARTWEGVRLIANLAPRDVQLKVQEAFAPAVLVGAYGITELTGVVSYPALGEPLDVRLDSCGPPLPGLELRVVDPETGAVLGPGERGELVGRGIQRFDGYYRNPEQTAEAIDSDGFFHTGDLCALDAEGRISYHGRLKDMLKVGGENVSALEVESYLATHPAVKLAQVVGVPDERLVEVPAAFVELAPGAEASEEELIAYCTGAIARFKVPRYVRFVSEWPMSATKIQKFRLREQIAEELS